MAERPLTPSAMSEPCEHCKKPDGYVNHVPGHIFVGMGHGWQPCIYCGGAGLKPPFSIGSRVTWSGSAVFTAGTVVDVAMNESGGWRVRAEFSDGSAVDDAAHTFKGERT